MASAIEAAAAEGLGIPVGVADVDVLEFPNTGPMRSGPHTAALIIRLGEWLVVKNRQDLKALVVDQLADGRRRFVLDFSECGYIDSSGLGVLLSITRKVEGLGGRVIVSELNDDIVTLLELTKMDTVLEVAPRVIDALARFEDR